MNANREKNNALEGAKRGDTVHERGGAVVSLGASSPCMKRSRILHLLLVPLLLRLLLQLLLLAA